MGIGGAGLSGYALLARAWGAEVGGWDRVETPYLRALDGVDVVVSADPEARTGWETVVSSAYAGRVAGRSRAEFLSELVALRRSIVVAGAHGKSTTTAMIAFVLDRLGRDPAFLIGADVPQLGGNAAAGDGWLVVEGDESDRTVEELEPEIAVVTNVDLDHHATFASRAEVDSMLAAWLDRAPLAVRGADLEPYVGPLAVIGEHNRRNAATALAALQLAGVPEAEAAPALAEFSGVGRRLERRGQTRGVSVLDTYAHHPAEIAADLAAVRETTAGRVLVLFQPHLYTRTRHLAREFGRALAASDAVAVADVYAAREDPIPGVDGKLVVDAVADTRPGAPIAWTPDPVDGARWLARRARDGDTVLTVGAGDVDRAAEVVLAELG